MGHNEHVVHVPERLWNAVQKDLGDGYTWAEVCHRYNVSSKTVAKIAKGHRPVERQRGLSEANKRKARHLRDRGWTLLRIANELGCSKSYVWTITES